MVQAIHGLNMCHVCNVYRCEHKPHQHHWLLAAPVPSYQLNSSYFFIFVHYVLKLWFSFRWTSNIGAGKQLWYLQWNKYYFELNIQLFIISLGIRNYFDLCHQEYTLSDIAHHGEWLMHSCQNHISLTKAKLIGQRVLSSCPTIHQHTWGADTKWNVSLPYLALTA